jgi:hypothetical protein
MARGIDANAQPDHQGFLGEPDLHLGALGATRSRAHPHRSGGGQRAFTWSSEKPSSEKE